MQSTELISYQFWILLGEVAMVKIHLDVSSYRLLSIRQEMRKVKTIQAKTKFIHSIKMKTRNGIFFFFEMGIWPLKQVGEEILDIMN